MAAGVALATLCTAAAVAQSSAMTFFVTSVGPGKGGNLGGLDGADRHCSSLAKAVGAGGRTWRAYLSTQGPDGVDARDRIGRGPWMNAKGVVIADDVAQLHAANKLGPRTALTETGEIVNGPSASCVSNLRRGAPCEAQQPPNVHDILTGSRMDGTRFDPGTDMTCAAWTKSDGGSAMVGHSDRIGLDDSAAMTSWNSSHRTRGCSQPQLRATGGDGLFYCFAAD